MVKGIDSFRTHFTAYSYNYVLIGGTAATLAMEEVGADFRATKDLDIVLCIEALDGEFAQAFWKYVKAGGYENRQKSTGNRHICFLRSGRIENLLWIGGSIRMKVIGQLIKAKDWMILASLRHGSFVLEPQRTIVAFSRAKKLLIVFASSIPFAQARPSAHGG
ncbi:MAG: hypothetical protein PHF70_15220 [Opitutales bacterium]|nr:hypothetical protein [Opitutales bacterium]